MEKSQGVVVSLVKEKKGYYGSMDGGKHAAASLVKGRKGAVAYWLMEGQDAVSLVKEKTNVIAC